MDKYLQAWMSMSHILSPQNIMISRAEFYHQLVTIKHLLRNQDFWFQYSFYVTYAAIIGFVVQIVILQVERSDYLAVLGIQIIALMGSALIFTTANEISSPSHRTKSLYFIITDAPWWGMLYYWSVGMVDKDLMMYFGLSLIAAMIGGRLYPIAFDLYQGKVQKIKHYFD